MGILAVLAITVWLTVRQGKRYRERIESRKTFHNPSEKDWKS